jgi:serine/threonine-protein kinase
LAPQHGGFDNEYIAQFQKEGQAAAALIHPNIVGLHAIGYIADTHFLEMEYVPGISLQELINKEGPLPSDRALRLATMVADGLAAAHRVGIIHRDVKPANVLVTPEGTAKVGDFGLAKKMLSDDEESSKDFCGTPNYMAPELFHGHDASPASDVYALGLCLFQMLIGKLPWQESSLTQLAAFGRTEAIPNVREIRPELSPAIAECVELLTASSLSQRPANAVAASKMLHAVMGSERDIESMLIEAFGNDMTTTWSRAGERYSLTRQLPGNRRQIVFVETTQHATLERILLIYSTCCDANPIFYEQALRQNWIVMHGSLAIRDIDGKPMFVVINAYPRSTVAPEEIRRSVVDIATQADEVERQLTGMDRH